MAKQYCVLFDL